MEGLGVIVREGIWLYGGTTRVGVRIRATSIRYGSGDHDDPPEIRDDVPVSGFSVEWERAGGGGWDGGISTQFYTIELAMAAMADATGGTVEWLPKYKRAE